MSYSFQESRNVSHQVIGPPPRPEEDRRSRVPNVPLILVTVAILLFFTPIVLFVHRVQTMRTRGMHLEAASYAAERQKWTDAERHLRDYLAIAPDDGVALARLAYVVDMGAYSWSARLRSVSLYSQALDRLPNRNDLRVRIAELQLDTNPRTALKTAELALSREPANGAALAVKAKAMQALLESQNPLPAEVEKVITAYRDAHEKSPSNIECAVQLATMYRQFPEISAELLEVETADVSRAADQLIDDMVAKNSSDAKAYMARYNYRVAFSGGENSTIAVDADVRRAMELDPQAAAVRIAAARGALDIASDDPLVGSRIDARDVGNQSLDLAAENLRLALLNDSFDHRGYLGLSYVETIHQRFSRAIDVLSAGLMKGDRFQPMLNARLAELLLQERLWNDADRAILRLETSVQVMRERQRLPSEIQQFDTVAKVLRASWYLAPSNPRRSLKDALPPLRDASRLSSSVNTTAGTNYRLGKAFASLGQWDLAASAYQNAWRSNPEDFMSAVGAADALRRSGRFSEASESYLRILSSPMVARFSDQDRSSLWIDNARAQLGAQLHRSRDGQDWTPFENAVANARQAKSSAVMPLFLEMSSRFLGHKRSNDSPPANTEGALRENQAEFWRLAGEVYRAMARAHEAKDSDVLSAGTTTRVKANTSLALVDKAKDGRHGLARTRSFMEYFATGPAAFRPRVFSLQAGMRPEDGNDLDSLREHAERYPDDWESRWQWALLAMERGDEKELLRLERDLERIEGPEGTLWRYARVRRLLDAPGELGPAGLEKLAELTGQLNARRPEWSMSRVADGMVSEAQGRFDDASLAYLSALELGDQSAGTLSRLLGTLSLSEKPDEAWTRIEQAAREDLLAPAVLPVVVGVAIKKGEFEFAVLLARMAVEADRSPGAYLELGLALMALGGSEGLLAAERALEEAEKLAPTDLAVRVARLHLYLNQDLPAGSAKGVDVLRGVVELLGADETPLSPTLQAVLLASVFSCEGDVRLAEGYGRRAAQNVPVDGHSQGLPSNVFVTLAMVEPLADLWDGHLQGMPSSIRRTLGTVLLASGALRDREIGAILLADDPRSQAMALATRGGPRNRKLAEEQLAAISEDPREDVLRANLHRLAGRNEEAFELLAKAARDCRDPRTLLDFVEVALATKNWDDASRAIETLGELELEDTVLTPLAIRCLSGQGNMEDAVHAAKEYVDLVSVAAAAASILEEPSAGEDLSASHDLPETADRLARASVAVGWLREAGLDAQGLQLLRELVRREPRAAGLLAESLVEMPGGWEEAVAICSNLASEARREESVKLVESATVWARVLAYGSISSDRVQGVEELFQQCLRDPSFADVEFLSALARLRESQGRLEDAIELARKGAEERPESPATWSLLARLLAAAEDRQVEAMSAARRGERLAGPTADLLDVRGMILLGSLRVEEAIRVLEASIALGGPATALLHLAEAYADAGEPREAARVLEKFQAAGVKNLNPRDAKALKRLSAL